MRVDDCLNILSWQSNRSRACKLGSVKLWWPIANENLYEYAKQGYQLLDTNCWNLVLLIKLTKNRKPFYLTLRSRNIRLQKFFCYYLAEGKLNFTPYNKRGLFYFFIVHLRHVTLGVYIFYLWHKQCKQMLLFLLLFR